MNQVRASHILVKDQKQAQDIKTRIEAGESFELLAESYSQCPSKEQGGDLGWFGKGQMVKPFEEAAFSQAVDTVSAPVKTQFGYHLIKVTETK